MSKQTGLLTFQGKMGKVSFFKRNGVDVARVRGGGLTKERIQNDPDLQRVRENLSEFKARAQAGKSFRRALTAILNMKDGTFGNRLSKVFTVINKRSEGIRGQRGVQLSKHRALVQGIELNSVQNFIDVFAAAFTSSFVAARNSAKIEVLNLKVKEMVKAPPSATHFRLMHLLGIVSDTVYDENSKNYGPSNASMNGLSQVVFSEYLPLSSTDPLSISLEVTLPGAPVLTDDVTVIQGLGIIFYDHVGTEYYSLTQNKAMKIVNVF